MDDTDQSSDSQAFTLPSQDLLQPRKSSSSGSMVSRTVPLLTGDALDTLGPERFPQRALYGQVSSQHATVFPERPSNPVLYINTNVPFSALICGVQGSGKSHSTAVLLESCLIEDSRIGALPAPLSALVFYLDTAAGGGLVQPCEAAYLAALDAERGGHATPPDVTVLVLPSNLDAMRQVYSSLPNVKVEPLHFSPHDISGERLLNLMRLDENSQMPIYMEAIMTILREMEHNFDYDLFCKKMKNLKLKSDQRTMLDLRLSLLNSCVKKGNSTKRVSSRFKKGQLTIVDLSSPFMDGESACGFFDLLLSLFIEADIGGTGKLVVLDEAHKYLTESKTGSSGRLTESVLAMIRQQRHLATRVVISSQEPTVVPTKFLDLCSFVIAHRFTSPAWMRCLSQHVSLAEDSSEELFSKIVSLETGEALVFAPSGLVAHSRKLVPQPDAPGNLEPTSEVPNSVPAHIGQGYLHVQSRQRITRDGGHAILAIPDKDATRLSRVSTRTSPKPEEGIAERALAQMRESSKTNKAAPDSSAFRIADYIVNQFTVHRATRLSLKNIRKHFDSLNESDIESALRQAEKAGLLRRQDSSVLPPKTASATSLSPPNSSATKSRVDIHVLSVADYVKNRMDLGALKLSVDNIQKHFAKARPALSDKELSTALRQAAEAGHVLTKLEGDKQYVTLPPQGPPAAKTGPPSAGSSSKAYSTLTAASVAAVTAIKLKGNHQRFAPLVRFVLENYAKKNQPVDVSAIRQHFLQSHRVLYGKRLKTYQRAATEAVSRGLLIDASGAAEGELVGKVVPVPDAKYDI